MGGWVGACVRACVGVGVCVFVFILLPLLFSSRGGRLRVFSSEYKLTDQTSCWKSILIQKPSAQIPKNFQHHGIVVKTNLVQVSILSYSSLDSLLTLEISTVSSWHKKFETLRNFACCPCAGGF